MQELWNWQEILGQFEPEGKIAEVIPYGSGHINDTFRVTMEEKSGRKRYILQRMNVNIFYDPRALVENIVNVTSFLRKKILERGGDPDRETLNVIPSRAGESFYQDMTGNYWRLYRFIENATSYDPVSYTHLDVYKRQSIHFAPVKLSQRLRRQNGRWKIIFALIQKFSKQL